MPSRFDLPMLLTGCTRWVVPCLLAALCSGCITVYQPLSSLQRPVVVDPRLANFEDARMLVRCHPSEDLPRDGAELLCRNVSTLFRNQGAHVDVDIPTEGTPGRSHEGPQADVVLDVKSKLVHQAGSMVLDLACYFTATLIPTYGEESYSQEITVRDGQGALLASDVLHSRFVHYIGAGVWAVNWVLDLLVRPENEKLTGDVANRSFSRDLYGQLSQLMFNARVRAQVLRGFESPPPQTQREND
jgi:hypothetical protein